MVLSDSRSGRKILDSSPVDAEAEVVGDGNGASR
jgi:hypothetical protein